MAAKVIYDGKHPEVADWDGDLPGETSNGCRDNLPMTGDPTDNCMELCADTPFSEAVAVQFVRMPPQLTCVGAFDRTELGRSQVLLG